MRTVNEDTIRFATIQLLPDMQRMSNARARVEVQERLDGSIQLSGQQHRVPAPLRCKEFRRVGTQT